MILPGWDGLPLHQVVVSQPFEKWELDFIGPIYPPARNRSTRYIITTTPSEYGN